MFSQEHIQEEILLAQWRKTHRRGETPPNFNDKRSKMEKHLDKKKSWRDRISLSFLKTERRRVIEAKIAHYEKMGNQRKLAIYRSKL